MKRFFALCVAVLTVLPLLAFGASADDTASPAKLDYAGRISRRDKYDKYIMTQTETIHSLWYHGKYLMEYPNALCLTSVLRNYMNDDLRNKYFSGSPFSGIEWKDDSVKAEYDNYFKSEAAKTGLPEIYYFIRFAEITKDELKYAMERSISIDGHEYADWMADTLYCDDWRVIIETYMSPELVVDMEMYLSDKPKYAYIDNLLTSDWWDYTIFRTPVDIIKTSLETLDTWNYSDKYWYDYYSFIDYLSREISNLDDNYKAELARRLAIYAERVGKSPSTGDTSGTRAVIFTSAAALAAVIPAAVLTSRRRRED